MIKYVANKYSTDSDINIEVTKDKLIARVEELNPTYTILDSQVTKDDLYHYIKITVETND